MKMTFQEIRIYVNTFANYKRCIVKMYKDKEVQNVKNLFVNVWRKNIFDIYVTEYGTALTTILPILFLYLNTVTVTAGTIL
jgi:hypothetical protein